MPTSRSLQTSLAAGEFDPLLWSREDVSFFYNSARLIENAIPLPQGGAKRREGWRFKGLQRGALSAIDLGGLTVTAVNGGTPANATDGDAATVLTTTGAIGVVEIYDVFRIDMGAASRVSAVDVSGLRIVDLPSGISGVTIALQSSDDGAAWTSRASILIGSAAYSRRFAVAPNSDLATARYWRLLVENSDDLLTATVELSEFKMWTEAGQSVPGSVCGAFSVHRLTTSIENEYLILATSGNADVFRMDTGSWVAAVALPHTDGQVRYIKAAPNLDTLILFNTDQPPWIIQKLAGDPDWQSDALTFDSVVQFPFSTGDVSGGENEIQFLRFDDMTAGDKLLLEYNGQSSDEIVWTADETVNAAALEAAMEGMEDFASVSFSPDDSEAGLDANLLLEFTGVDGKRSWPIIIVDILTGSGTVQLSRKQFGKPDMAELWSEDRGYPRCGAFYQGRFWMGGFRSRADVIVASRAGSLFDFKEDADPVAGSPIVIAPNVDDQITVHNIYPGRHLQIFTSSAEMYIPDEPVTIENIALKTTSRHGSNEETQPVDIQGGTLFSDRNGTALREYLFQDSEQSYSAEPVSSLAGHLMSRPRSVSMRRARDIDEPTLLLLANTGTDRNGDEVPAAMCVIDRAQQVTGFFRVKTQGRPVGFVASQGGDAFALTTRALDGPEWNYLEQFDADFMSDAGVKVYGSGSSVDLTGIAEHLDGQTVFVHVDGLPIGEFPVVENAVDLGGFSYISEVEVGLKMVPRIVLHPYKGRGDMSPTMQNMRIFRALLQLDRTAAVAICMTGDRPRPLSLQNHDSGFNDPTLDELLFTGAKRVSGIGRWQKEPCLEITQVSPMPFLLRSVTYDVRF